jgi:membrane glycosyltransferase
VTLQALIAIAILFLVAYVEFRLAVRVKLGQDRRWLAAYRDASRPMWLRGGALVARFASLAALSWAIAFSLASLALSTWISGYVIRSFLAIVALAMIVVGVVVMIWSVVVLYRNPDRLKPDWLRAEESVMPPTRPDRIDYWANLGFVALVALALVTAIAIGIAGLVGAGSGG